MNPQPLHALALDDDPVMLQLYSKLFGALPAWSLSGFTELNAADQALRRSSYDLVLIDLSLQGQADAGFSLLETVKALDPACECVVVSADRSFGAAQRALRLGADDYVAKGFSREEFEYVLRKVEARRRYKKIEARELWRAELVRDKNPMIGNSAKMQKLREQIKKLALSDIPVFIQAETGTGKELVARQLHLLSRDPAANFVAVDCPNIPLSMAEGFLLISRNTLRLGAGDESVGLLGGGT